ncbi:ribosomal biogenesis regulatory protein [Lipomyces japonicus]|uniref:ribosomal biogenesis regulatory protein n=1 Tax=Lipomyces japonicus TaxID=56871 RepID=UPI0034CEA454
MTESDSISSRPVTVEKEIPVTYDLGNLAVFDTTVLDPSSLSLKSSDDAASDREAYLKSVARDSAQLLINQILSLPVVTGGRIGRSGVDNSDGVFVDLPEPVMRLPREKPVPVAKPLTKWQKFAKQKGITPKARNTGNMVYDEAKGEWVKKWGYKGKNQEQPWVVELNSKGEAVDEDGKPVNKKRKTTKKESSSKEEK